MPKFLLRQAESLLRNLQQQAVRRRHRVTGGDDIGPTFPQVVSREGTSGTRLAGGRWPSAAVGRSQL
jgi:hypothetical protein